MICPYCHLDRSRSGRVFDEEALKAHIGAVHKLEVTVGRQQSVVDRLERLERRVAELEGRVYQR